MRDLDCRRCGCFKPADNFHRDKSNHRGRRYWCKTCVRAYQVEKGYTESMRVRALARYYANHEENKRKAIWQQKMLRYGLTEAMYNEMAARQGHRCLLCQLEKKLFVDHNHSTGVVRGLLCRECNSGIGMLQDDPAILERAIAYIRHARRPPLALEA